MEKDKRARKSKNEDFYLRYYVGHKGKYGHEFLEFELRHNGRLRYSNNSNYKDDLLIRKEVYVNDIIVNEIKRIISNSEILKYVYFKFREDDKNWPEPDGNGRQELEILHENEHISFATSKIGSYNEVVKSKDPKGMNSYYYLIQDLKCLIFSIIKLHFRVKPVS